LYGQNAYENAFKPAVIGVRSADFYLVPAKMGSANPSFFFSNLTRISTSLSSLNFGVRMDPKRAR
jgi:hypothetical protein